MEKKFLYCPICGSQGDDLAFAFYCMNVDCQNFRDCERENVNDPDDSYSNDFPYHRYYWPYGD